MRAQSLGAVDAHAELRARIADYLAAHHVMTVATTEPWAAAVFYVSDGFTLYFLSSPDSRHCRGFGADARVAVTIHEDYADWREIKGVQIEGVAEPVAAGELPRVRELYAAKFPFVRAGASAAIAAALARIAWYRITPRRVCLVDNAAGFGHRDCVDLPGGTPSA